VIKERISKWRIRVQLKARALKKIHFGSQSKNLYDVLRIFIQQLKKDDINERAGSMAFSYTIALFPFLLFLLNLIPYLQDFFPMVTTSNILSFVQGIIPADVYETISSTLLDIISKPRQSLLSLGFLFALLASTQGVVSMMNSFNAVYKTKENRGWLASRGIAIAIVLVLVLTVLAASSVMIVGSFWITELKETHLVSNGFVIFLFKTLKFLILLAVFDFGIHLPVCTCNSRQVEFFLNRCATCGAFDYVIFLRIYFLPRKFRELQQAVWLYRYNHRVNALALPDFRHCIGLL
jgi:membrane protein